MLPHPPLPAAFPNDDSFLLKRLHAGFWLLLFAIVPLAGADILAGRAVNPRVWTERAAYVAALIALKVLLWRTTSRRAALLVGISAVAVCCAASYGIAVATRGIPQSVLVLTVLVLGTATYVPWGWPAQLVAAALVVVGYVLEVSQIEGPLVFAHMRDVAGLASVAVVSVYLALESERFRILADAERIERQRRELESEHQRAFLRQVIDINPHLIFAKDRAGRFTLVNRAVADVYGTRVEDLVGKTDADFNPNREEVEHFRADDLNVMDTRRELLIPAEVITDAGGNRRWLSTIKRALIDADGSVSQVLGVATDITELRTNAERLREEAEIAGALARVGHEIIGALNRPDLLAYLCELTAKALGGDSAQVWMCDEDGDFIAAAQYGEPTDRWEALRVLRFPPEWAARFSSVGEDAGLFEVSAADLQALLPSELLQLASEVAGLMSVALQRGGELRGSLTTFYRRPPSIPSATRRRIATAISQLASLALENALLVEQLGRANRLKSDFMATMSHELRTPLNVIIGYSDLLHDGTMGPVNANQEDTLRRILAHSRRLLELITATLDVSRLETGQVPLHLETVPLIAVVADVDTRTAEIREKDGVVFSWELPSEEVVLRTDVAKLRVLLVNLIHNAMKFTAAGTVTVRVRKAKDQVEFAVADTGIGIAAEDHDLIFEPFRQGPQATDGQRVGVGLGLYIVRRLVETLGGRVSVESTPGKGSMFRVNIPATSKQVDSPPVASR